MKLISLTRIIIIATLGMFALLLFLGQETDESNTAFILRFIVDKALACGLAYSAYRLYKRWSKIDPWFMAYNKKIDNEYNG